MARALPRAAPRRAGCRATRSARQPSYGKPSAGSNDTFPAVRRSPWEFASERWPAALLVVAVTLGLTAAAAGASGTLYGSSNTGTTMGGPRVPELSTINIGTGAAALVGPLPFPGTGTTAGVTGIVCQPGATSAATAICYAQQADGGFHISRFDLSTGAAIGSPVYDGDSFSGLAYVGSTLYGTAILSGTLRTLNPTTGTSVDVGPTGAGDPISGLAWDGTTMYGIEGRSPSTGARLFTINLATGAATAIGNTGIKGAGSLQFGPDGNLYAGGDSNDGGHLYRVNKTTAAATLVGATGFPNLTGLALLPFPITPPPPPAVPTAITVTPEFTG